MDRCISLYSITQFKKLFITKRLFNKKYFQNYFSTVLMSFLLIVALNHYSNYLEYTFKYKSVYLITIVCFVGSVYLISCYLTGVLKTKNFKTN